MKRRNKVSIAIRNTTKNTIQTESVQKIALRSIWDDVEKVDGEIIGHEVIRVRLIVSWNTHVSIFRIGNMLLLHTILFLSSRQRILCPQRYRLDCEFVKWAKKFCALDFIRSKAQFKFHLFLPPFCGGLNSSDIWPLKVPRAVWCAWHEKSVVFTMPITKEHIRFFHPTSRFIAKKNAAAATEIIAAAYGENAVTSFYVTKRWYQTFRQGDFSPEDENRVLGRPSQDRNGRISKHWIQTLRKPRDCRCKRGIFRWLISFGLLF